MKESPQCLTIQDLIAEEVISKMTPAQPINEIKEIEKIEDKN
jgi:hypothetical protein